MRKVAEAKNLGGCLEDLHYSIKIQKLYSLKVRGGIMWFSMHWLNSRAVKIGLGLLVLYAGWRTYRYFFDTSVPTISVVGVEPNGYYAGDAPCTVIMSDGYKVKDLSLFLDTKPLVSHFSINRAHDEHAFTIPTKTLSNGPHVLKIEVRDASYRTNTSVEEIPFIVDNRVLQAAFVKSTTDLKVFQGKTLHIQFQVNKPIKKALVSTLSKTFICVPEADNSLIYECFIPISCEEQPNEYLLSIEIVDMVGNTMTLETKFQVVPYPFKQQNLALTAEKLKEETESGKPEKELEDLLASLVEKSPHKKLWRGTFYTPTDAKRVSTEFGTVRVTQHKGKYAHKAVDLIGNPKSVIWTTQDGIVIVKDRFVHSGNTIVVDHGCGIFSLFYHLDSYAPIEVGDVIHKGNPVGTLGKTGYATGYHLHWEMRINNVPVDPLQWVKHDF